MQLLNIHFGSKIMHASLYDILKILHILSGVIVFASVFIYGALAWSDSKNIKAQAGIKLAWFVTLPALGFQLLTGFSIIGVQHYSMHMLWVWGTFLGFIVLVCSWLASIFFLSQKQYSKWKLTLILSFSVLMIMLFFMANQTI
jgi:hypothetical protein